MWSHVTHPSCLVKTFRRTQTLLLERCGVVRMKSGLGITAWGRRPHKAGRGAPAEPRQEGPTQAVTAIDAGPRAAVANRKLIAPPPAEREGCLWRASRPAPPRGEPARRDRGRQGPAGCAPGANAGTDPARRAERCPKEGGCRPQWVARSSGRKRRGKRSDRDRRSAGAGLSRQVSGVPCKGAGVLARQRSQGVSEGN